MGIRSNKARADRLAGEAEAERRARRAHLARARDIFGRRLGSPAGLAVCFGAGAVAGLRHGKTGSRRAPPGAESDEDGEEAGVFERMSDSTIGNILIRLAAATLVRYMLSPSGHGDEAAEGDDGAAAEDVPGGVVSS